MSSTERKASDGRNGSYWLVPLDGKTRKIRLPANSPLLVGRGTHNHLVLDDYRISRQHSRVAPERDGYVVYDLNSVNGTFVNGLSVRRQVLLPNDEVRFGPRGYRLELRVDDADEHPTVEDCRHRTPESLTRIATIPAPPPTPQDPERIEPPRSDPHAFHAQPPNVDLTQLEGAYDKLGTLYAFMQAISTTIDRSELLDLIGTKLRDVYPPATSVGIYLRGVPDEQFTLAHFVGGEPRAAPTMPESTWRPVIEVRRATFGPTASAAATRAEQMYVPLIARDDALGIIHIAADARAGEFGAADLELFSGLAASAALMLQNTRMHEESLVRERLRRDLELATQIQKSFLPREVISVEGIELLATYRAAYAVGGDFYDVFWVGPDKLAVFIGDISGKGVAAALLMARISGELRVAALAHVDPVAVLSIMNKAIIGRGQPELFFTAIYFTLDVKTGEIVLANAGHPSPYLCHADGSVEPVVDGASLAVGMLDDPEFESTILRLAEGDSLLLYTDGIIEAVNGSGLLYGAERLEACIAGAGARPKDIAKNVLQSVEQHAEGLSTNDDITLFVCHRSATKSPTMQPRRLSDRFWTKDLRAGRSSQ